MIIFTLPFFKSGSISTLNPIITESRELISRLALADTKSTFPIGPIPAFTMLIFCCFSKVIRASKLPKESAFIIIPFLSRFKTPETSFLNTSFILSRLLSTF